MEHSSTKVHHGNNVRTFRELLGLKQEALAHMLGDDWSQKRISRLEAKEVIDEEELEEIAKALKVPVDALTNFSEHAAINIISSTLHDNAGSVNNNCTLTFNPIDKLMEAMEENKKLYAALLKEKDDKIALLERLADKK